MNLSVCIPYYESDPGKKEVLDRCVASLVGADEIIILAGKQPSLSNAINQLLELAHGDYIIVANDDVVLSRGNLKTLCKENTVVSPMVNENKFVKAFHSHMFCIPRTVYEDVGPQFEGYDGFYYDDSDYWMKLEGKGYSPIIDKRVNIDHPSPGRTLGTYSGNDERIAKNRALFIERWGLDNVSRVE